MSEPQALFKHKGEEKRELFPRFFFATLLIALVVARVIGSIVFPVYDDAFITYRYAQNLATGLGFVYHANDWVLGATCPAFGVFASLLLRLGLPLPTSITVINIACDAVILWLTYRVLTAHLALHRNRWFGVATALLFGTLFAISPTLNRICVGGMEVNLFLLGSLGTIFLYHRGIKIPAVALAAVCYFLRPEGVLLVAILCGLELLSTKRLMALRLPLVAAAVMAPPLLLIYRIYGHVLPQSVTAKSHIVKKSIFVTAKGLVAPDPICYVLLPLAVWGVVTFLKGGGLKKNVFLRTLLCWYVLYVAAYLVARPQIWSWYAEPIQYVQLVFAAIGTVDLVGRLFISRKEGAHEQPLARVWGVVASGLVICFWCLIYFKTGPSGATHFVYKPLQQWGQNTDLRKASILAEDIGAVGYYTNAYVYDTAGLVWPPALKYKTIEEMIRTRKPDYLFLNADQESIEMILRVRKSIPYQPIQRFSLTGDSGLELEPKLYPEVWKQDYMLFKNEAK